ncbi:MAG TPA: hypothetical protein VEX41_01280 [Candidatus Eisenbacteria bacterium]|nr:hypothetical protein [Candidatus Eisenbacteria bacterium]
MTRRRPRADPLTERARTSEAAIDLFSGRAGHDAIDAIDHLVAPWGWEDAPDGPHAAMSGPLRERPAAASASPDLLGDPLSWSRVEAKYKELAIAAATAECSTPPPHAHRRSEPSQPSRPEVAHALNVSTSTLDRRLEKLGKGKHWPPPGL